MESSDADRDARARRAGRAALAAGLGVLALGIAVAVSREDGDSAGDAVNAEQRAARYDRLLRNAARRPPRYSVSLVQLTLGDYRRLTERRGPDGTYFVVPTEPAKRIETGRPPLHPDFGVLPHEEVLAVFASAFREGRIRERRVWVFALLVTETAPGRAEAVQLKVERLALRRYQSIVDPLDLPREGRSASVTWKPQGAGARSLVPLALVHECVIPRTPANADVIQAYGDLSIWRLVTDVVLAPRRMFVLRSHGQDVPVSITRALGDPLLLGGG